MKEELKKIHDALGITSAHLANYKLKLCEQPELRDLIVCSIDVEGRPFILEKSAAMAWKKMFESAAEDKVLLEPISGFRSYIHQKNLILKKLADGKSLEAVLTETALPGFSEHHSGRAVDLCTERRYRLDEHFERTQAFEWLSIHATHFGFKLSYPRDNPLGIAYEPWHWCFTQ